MRQPRRLRGAVVTADLRKLKRAGVEPARVFGRRDFDPKSSGAVLHYITPEGLHYYSPSFPTWMVLDGECKVLDKACQRYGMREAPVTARWVEYSTRLLADEGEVISLGDPEDYSLSNGVVFSAYTVGPCGVVPATPVMYVMRRFGEPLVFKYDNTMKVVRAWAEGTCVAVIRIIAADRVALWLLEGAA